jgi:hypothetical protein
MVCFLLDAPVIYNNNLKESMHGCIVVRLTEGVFSKRYEMICSPYGGVAIEICNVLL